MSGTSLENDVRLVKAALLYSDKVRLCSVGASMMLSVAELQHPSRAKQVDLLSRLAPLLVSEGAAAVELIEGIDTYKSLSKKRGKSRDEVLAVGRLEAKLAQAWKPLEEKSEELASASGVKELLAARKAGLLDIYKFRSAGTSDIVNSIQAALDFHAGRAATVDWDDIILEFLDLVKVALSSGMTYPIFDDQTGSLMQAFQSEGALDISEVAVGRGKHAALATQLFEQLPMFDEATVTEIIDIRRALDRPLVRFRAAMIGFAESIQSAPWDDDFGAEVENVFYKEIEPAVLEIQEAVETNTYLRELARRVADRPPMVRTAGSLAIGAGVASLLALPALLVLAVGAAGVISPSAYLAYEDWLDKRNLVEQKQLYLYYKVGQRLEALA